MKFGKTIKIFLIDGDPNGRMTCELSNWTGKAYKVPRIKVKDCSDRSDLFNTGIYLLLGKDEEGQDQVYIGEAETILKRLNQHLTQKDFWNEAVIFVSKDENLNKAHIKYLESRLYEIAKTANRYKIANTVTPTQSSISESDRAEMEEFLENAKLLVNTLGHKVFEEKRELKARVKQQEFFMIVAPRGANAQGEPTSEGFVVLKGSKIATSTVTSFPPSMQKLRQDLIDKKVVVQNGEHLELTDDYIFASPSTAAAIVMGRNANGLIEWKLPNGRTLKGVESEVETTPANMGLPKVGLELDNVDDTINQIVN
ncbi:GIY-YIG nuclease family protein [Spirosoma linguale]|uniref:Methionine sulfoxide reductase A n=1 Tax=Spirosoma linguale (strain ATCC 33905 / DSM 74 / LMG 10896 / Claus 1) TaxID=504472 RepID=D2QST4_SPILD|nr:methionine sulfoxide reductase A [Spirosoma linguale DSM 74]